jgi:deazaflavin-dependent oxidoreductase (nitroreductase family)
MEVNERGGREPGGIVQGCWQEAGGQVLTEQGLRRGYALVLTGGMPGEDDYGPSPRAWVRDQVELYESSAGARGTTLRDTGLPVVIITNRGARSGKLRKTPVMRVEHEGRYAAVASQGGAPSHPRWYYNLRASPSVELQDGPHRQRMIAREVTGDERAQWWERAVAAYPPYAEYQQKTTRQIPVFVLERAAQN